jgi:hypothetical protein
MKKLILFFAIFLSFSPDALPFGFNSALTQAKPSAGGGGSVTFRIDQTFAETPNGVITTFTTLTTYSSVINIKFDGISLIQGSDYTLGAGSTITLTPAFTNNVGIPNAGNVFRISYTE